MINKLMPGCSFIKRPPLPEHLIYKTRSYINDIPVDQFVMFSVKHPKDHAVMTCFPTLIEREGKPVPSLYIWRLHSHPSGCGFGRDLLKFAKKYSENLGCHGYFHLSADSSWNPNRVPHIFYRKCGLSTPYTMYDKELDCFIKKNKTATHKDFETMDMFYPPIVHKVKSSSKFLSLINSVLKTLLGNKNI